MKKCKLLTAAMLLVLLFIMSGSVYATEEMIDTQDNVNPWLQSITVSNGPDPIWIVQNGMPTGETLGNMLDYNPTTKTLTMNNFNGYKSITLVTIGDINVELIGENSFPGDSAGFNAPVENNVTIMGSGSLSFSNPNNLIGSGMWCTNLTINSGKITTSGGSLKAVNSLTVNGGILDIQAYGEGCLHAADNITINGGTLNLQNLWHKRIPSMLPTLAAKNIYINPVSNLIHAPDGYSMDINGDDKITGNVAYRTHVENIGWQTWKNEGNMSGTEGFSYRLEGIELQMADDIPADVGIRYRTHVQNIGWQDYVNDGQPSGTEGLSYRLEAIKIHLTGEQADNYDIYYRVHAENFGWLGWAKNDEQAGSAGYGYRLEAIEIQILEKGKTPDGRLFRSFVDGNIIREYNSEIFRLINNERIANNVPPLRSDAVVELTAQIRSYEVAENFTKYRPDGRHFSTILDDTNIKWSNCYEMRDRFSDTPAENVNALMSDPSLRNQILSEKYTKLGIGCNWTANGTFFTQMFV